LFDAGIAGTASLGGRQRSYFSLNGGVKPVDLSEDFLPAFIYVWVRVHGLIALFALRPPPSNSYGHCTGRLQKL